MAKKTNEIDKTIEFKIEKSEEKRFNNDPIDFQKNEKIEERDVQRENKRQDLLAHGFDYSLNDICCGCWKKDIDKKKKYFDNACSVLYYYMDVITYIKKMIEIDIIKDYLFSKDEIKLISFISNPNFADIE